MNKPKKVAGSPPDQAEPNPSGPIQIHPYCSLFPVMTGENMAKLTADIKENGLREPIVTLDGKVLDGQNRLSACIAAGVSPKFTPYEGDDPISFVESVNLNGRRHLDPGQRAMIGTEIARIRNEQAASTGDGVNLPRATTAQTAAKYEVSEKSVKTARAVSRTSPALAAEVKAGNVSLNAAATAAKAPARKLRLAVAKGPEAINRLAARLAQHTRNAGAAPRAGITLDNLATCGVYTSTTAAPSAVDPRTPGQVNRDAYKAAHDLGKDKDECWEDAARAVLNR